RGRSLVTSLAVSIGDDGVGEAESISGSISGVLGQWEQVEDAARDRRGDEASLGDPTIDGRVSGNGRRRRGGVSGDLSSFGGGYGAAGLHRSQGGSVLLVQLGHRDRLEQRVSVGRFHPASLEET